MNIERELEIKAAIYEVGLLFNQQPSDDKINAYAKALQNYSPKQITFAFNQVILSGSAFFPSLAEILTHLRPPVEKKEDQAPLIAAEILNAIHSFSSYDEVRMDQHHSENARLVLKMLGGTSEIRNAPADNLGTTKAQLVKLAVSVLSSRDANAKTKKLETIGINDGRVLDFPKQELRTVDFSGYLPTEGA